MAAITIKHCDTGNGELDMIDHDGNSASTIHAAISEIVTWTIDPHSGVKEITKIDKKEGSDNVFNPLPRRLGKSKNWQGTIDPDLDPSINQETYFIEWVDETAGKKHTYDPLIQINPRIV
ncbi:hypothetical protein BH20BAC1_BH20BAC1_06480 [soil metagenome]